jgi:hypothetical protein
MQWVVRSQRSVFKDQWIDLREADVELPDGRHLNHKVVHTAPGAGAVVVNENAEVLLLWRHRFITDTCGWGIPVGKIDPGEDPAHAAARETELASATSTPRWSRAAAGAEDIGEIHRTSRVPAPLRPCPGW